MSAIEALLRQPAAHAVAWALLQFVWQGALIGVLTAVALAALRRSAADVRYVVATIALALMLTMPIVTALQSWRGAAPSESPVRATSAANVPRPEGVSSQPTNASVRSASTRTDPSFNPTRPGGRQALSRTVVETWLPTVLLVWITGVSLLTLRLMSAWLWVQRLKTHGETADEGWQHMAARLCRRLHILRPVRLLESALVEVPTVIGWIKPVILLPGSALAGLSPQQLEAILAHELAHIRRHDYLVNLVQTLVETLLFYHPAVWWLSHRIRVERENCCDDLAVSLCGDPYTYARALADLEERRGTCGHLVVAASGGSLLQRIRRLLGAPTSHAGRGPGWLAGTAAVLVMGTLAAGALGNNMIRAQQAAAAPVAPSPVNAAQKPAPARTTAVEASAARVQAAARSTRRALPVATTGHVVDALPAAAIADVAGETQPALPVATQDHAAAVAAVVAPLDTREDGREAAAPAIAVVSERVATAAPVRHDQDTAGNFMWSHNGEKLEVNYRGEIDFSDDDTEVRRISPGGHLKIRDGERQRGRAVEIRPDSAGKLAHRYWVGQSERPFEPEGRQWLAQVLPRFIRRTGIGADRRVARILKNGGPAAVLTEIGRIEGSWAKRVYFRELFQQASLDPPTVRQALAQAGREIDSDFELASLLIASADRLLLDEATRKAYFDAARSIDSDFEMRRVYGSALKRGPVSAAVLSGILDASRSIGSDFELASLLAQVATSQPLDPGTRAPFFAAVATVESDFEQRRVLSTLASRGDLPPDTIGAIVQSAIDLDSDFELATLLVQVVKEHNVEGAVRDPFFRAVDSIGSPFERGRVLQALARRQDVSSETLQALLRAVQGMKSSHEASQVLLSVAASHTISGPARDLYLDAVDGLGEFEQGRVLTALVRSERRK